MKRGVIFISHSSKDRGKANAAVGYLERLGYACWIAPRDIDAGSDYPSQITGAIRGCAALLLVMSENANASEPVLSEVSLAETFKKDILVLRITDAPFSKAIEQIYSRSMHLTHGAYRIDAFSDFYRGLDDLSDLMKLLGIEAMGAAYPADTEGPDERTLPVDGASDLGSYDKKDYTIFSSLLLRCNEKKRGTALVPSGVTGIGARAFSSCAHLVKIVLPPTVTKIGKNAFEYCREAKEIVLPSVKTIGAGAFCGCNRLRTLALPGSLCKIGMGAFEGCSALTALDLPRGLKKIPMTAFGTCLKLERITLPEGLEHIGMGAFEGCEALSFLRLPETLGGVSAYTFFECKSLREVVIPAGVKKLGMFSFCGCENLERVVLQEGLKKIGMRAFYLDQSLKELAIPSSVKHISGKAFAWCGALARVTLPARFRKRCKRIFGAVAEKIEFTFI